ncbi:MAG: hypothetical protein UT32_C0011G0041 [Parcubacteria group bacterium GW2011_GWC2_39_14]|nr:MAG: hypothetical protein UT32_C0011G0041 [Parcubacteria group bacterium GW2011_GWC2_39_14]KKR55076.1 MAG: hypothetical protein UT91_C0005G0077 [Parcubacteria group bacterium GW2011_GWA2_40_23]
MYYTYVLEGQKTKNLYAGFTPDDVYHRSLKHNAGLVPSTKNRGPWNVIYYEAHLSRDDALRREAYFKTTDGKRAIRLMLRSYFRKNNQ